MAKRAQPDMIEEFESAAERMAHWISENRMPVGLSLLALLGLAGGWGVYNDWSQDRQAEASNALDRVRSSYMIALGAAPDALEEPELANPEAARSIREEYVLEFQDVAVDHAGTVAGTLALFEAAELLQKLGRAERGEEAWAEALESASDNPALQGLLQQRIAGVYEDRGAWAEAAAAHQAAGRIEEYPLRYWALVDAARCYAAAGQAAQALALYEEVDHGAPDLPLPAHLRIQRRELRATAVP